MTAITPVPAQATSSGCSAYSSVETPWIPVPAGWLCFSIYGGGSNIDYMRADWRATNLCNWRIDWVIYSGGRTWWRSTGAPHNHCDYVTSYRDREAGWAPTGSEMCAELYNVARGVKIEATCHHIVN